MQIDWFTVIAQLVNFLILVWLLKRFLYKPILAAIDAREAKIAKTLKDAATTQQLASDEQNKYLNANAELENQRSKLLQEATAAANEEATQLLSAAHAAATVIKTSQQLDQQREIAELHKEIASLTLAQVFGLTRKILSGLASTTLEDAMLNQFTVQLEQMPADPRQVLIAALISEPSGGVLRSSLPLDAARKQLLQSCIDSWVGQAVPLEFATADNLICGFQLNAKGQQCSWSIAENLNELKTAMEKKLEQVQESIPAIPVAAKHE